MSNLPKSPGKPDLLGVLDEHQGNLQKRMNCVQIGVIQSFNNANQTATVKIALKQVITNQEDGTVTYAEYPLLAAVPVMVLFGGTSFMSMPITAGDNCILLFNDRELDQWYSGSSRIPQTGRVHDLSDAIAIVGINPLPQSIASYLANGIRLSHNGTSRMDFTDAAIMSMAALFTHSGDMRVTGNLYVEGITYGNEGTSDWHINANIKQDASHSIHAGNGATGTFNSVEVVDGIVVGGTT